ncbi:hypothetical protein KM043_006147 [Ampulex compressa]|nr:hypothetical protein KM043_006147 [Ampulex compressa]
MGKTPKKAAPGGDERNLYVCRLKAATAPSKASESSLPKRQRETDGSNRTKLSGVERRVPSGSGKGFKSKLRSPVKLGSNQPTRRFGKLSGTSKEGKVSTLNFKGTQSKTADMQPDSDEAEIKANASAQKEVDKEEDTSNQNDECREKVTETDNVDLPAAEQVSESQESTREVEENVPTRESAESKETENGQEDTAKQNTEQEEHEEMDIKLSFEAEESPVKIQEQESSESVIKEDVAIEEIHSVQSEVKNVTVEKEDLQSESQTDTESYSVDIVESTTSEVSETSEAVSQNESQKEREREKLTETAGNDVSFVSYDSSIMLKDVQIKLNDCLKENSKLYDVRDTEQSTPNPLSREMSFGKTLRSISGRHSISRMRHVTIRDRLSPNSSLFVNTSTMSLPADETSDCKILRYSSGLSDTYSTNGSPSERKRKLDPEDWSSTKKPKTEVENNFLHTSISLLKGLRRPVQVSTPNVEPYKFDSSKLNISGLSDDDGKMSNESTIEGTNKWCIIM